MIQYIIANHNIQFLSFISICFIALLFRFVYIYFILYLLLPF